jgi:hypothetical protein
MIGFDTLMTLEVSTVMAEGGASPGFLVNYSDGAMHSGDAEISSLSLTHARPVGLDAWVGATPAVNTLNGTGTAVRALRAPALSVPSSEWPTAGGGDFAQNRGRGVYTDPDLAARELLDQLWLLAAVHEYGALVCESGGRYTWSRWDTSRDSGYVDTRKLVSCGLSTTWAVLHAHTSSGQVEPSVFSSGDGSDAHNANAEPTMRFYAATPTENHYLPEPRKWRYQGPNSRATAMTWNGTAWVVTPF